MLLTLLVDDEARSDAAERVWLASEFVVCAEIGYVEARAALAAAHRTKRLTNASHAIAKRELDGLWQQVDAVPITRDLVVTAAELAETERLRGYDAVHLAAAIVGNVTVFASADTHLLEAAHRRGLDTANPLS